MNDKSDSMNNTIEIIKDNGEVLRVSKSNILGLQVNFLGNGNHIIVYENTDFQNCDITCGDNNTIKIGKTRRHIKNLKIASRRAQNSFVTIGNGFSCVGCQINMNESSSVYIGNDCMFSFDIVIFTSDGHAIYDNTTLECINYGQDIIIGNHVWIGYNVLLLKGSNIADNCVVGARSLISGQFMDKNVIIAGHLAKVIKRNTNWSRKSVVNYMAEITSSNVDSKKIN
jgi:acetyltransferase-like isoleucine patch superfamily enzyme